MPAPHFLHVFSTFNVGGPQIRAIRLLNHWGRQYRHSIVSVTPGEMAAMRELHPAVQVDCPNAPDFKGGNVVTRLKTIRKFLHTVKPDLVLTYNWGAIEVVAANRLGSKFPLVHHEDGFGPDEAAAQHPRRLWFRRAALFGADRLVVPSQTLAVIAKQFWWCSPEFIAFVPNGVDIAKFDAPVQPNAIPGLQKSPGELVVGTVTGLRPEKNLRRLVRVFAAAARNLPARLVIVGAGPERETIHHEAKIQQCLEKIHLPGYLPDPWRYLANFDIFAISSDTEQFPFSLIEAMAARLPCVATSVGDIASIVSAENQPLIIAPGDEEQFAACLHKLLSDEKLRSQIGTANREKVEKCYAASAMQNRYERIYCAAMTRSSSKRLRDPRD